MLQRSPGSIAVNFFKLGIFSPVFFAKRAFSDGVSTVSTLGLKVKTPSFSGRAFPAERFWPSVFSRAYVRDIKLRAC